MKSVPFNSLSILYPSRPKAFATTPLIQLFDPYIFRQQNPRDVEVKRRRQSGSGQPPSPRRADTPDRGSGGDDRSGGSYSGGGSGFPSGGSSGGRGIRLPVWAVIAIVILYFIFRLFSGGDQAVETPQSAEDFPTNQVEIIPTLKPQIQPTRIQLATRLPSSGSPDQTWLVMLFQGADDKILEQDILMDLNEVEKVGSTDQVKIVSQIDRYSGGYSGEGNWTSARRYLIEADQDLLNLTSPVLDDLGEVNMADGDTLVDFVLWAVDQYPSDKYVLILSDHGMGWPGGWSDASQRSQDSANVPITSAIGDNIFLMELDRSLEQIVDRSGIGKFELIGMDACLMSDLEVFTALEPYANYAVASQETEPGIGWAYASFLEYLAKNPMIDGAGLGQLIVDSYIRDDQRLLDDRARADFVGQSSPMSSLFGGGVALSAAELRAQLERDVTLTAVDLTLIPQLNQSLNNLAYLLQGEQQNFIARARNYSQSYTSVWGNDVPPSYIDLGHFSQLLINENTNQPVINAADQVIQSIQRAVIFEKHGRRKAGSTGISIYFPNSKLYSNRIAGAQSYTRVADRFAKNSLWDDFLAFHYTNRGFDVSDAAPVEPPSGTTIRGPGTGVIDISEIRLSDTQAAPGSPVQISTTISGEQIGYIYLLVGYYDQVNNSILMLDTDYLESSDTREVNGIFYPAWPQGESFNLNLSWEPTVFEIGDGVISETVMLTPLTYGASSEDAVYTVDGLFTFGDSGEQRHSRLYFRQGQLQQVFGFTDQDGVGAPAEIYPSRGDTFTIQQKWMDLNPDGSFKENTLVDGSTLTFGDQMFTWQEVYAAPGDYLIGVTVKDMDGNATQSFSRITVR